MSKLRTFVNKELTENFYNKPATSTCEESVCLYLTSQTPELPLIPQSGNAGSATMTMDGGSYENVKFSDQHSDHAVDIGGVVDSTRTGQDSSDASLANFFSRPIKIREIQWGTGTVFTDSFLPWALYFENPRVANRMANYNLLRCKLRIKILINGNSFLYGRALAAYQPYSGSDNMTNVSSLISESMVSLSQMPRVFLNPTESSGGEMVLPFFYHKNYLNIPTSDWDEMGTLHLQSINGLKHANGAADAVTVSVFAWAEDVSLSVLTSVEPDTLVPQSGEIDEANLKGIISGPATRIAHAAGLMSSIPAIAPYAIATSKMASLTANMAKVLGYSRPPCTADPAPYRPTLISSLALTTVPDGATKLTVDDKQELSIDPTLAGVNSADPLDILSIAQRESFLTKFSWPVASASETLLWNSRISPVTWAESGSGAQTAHWFPATAMAALPFKYWTGTMNFRFQVVSSGFHRGRLKIVYDPNFLATNEYNTNYVEIVDIAEKTDFTISIGNGQAKTFLEHIDPGIDSVTQMYSTTAYTTKDPGNGVVGVYIVNELTVPNSTVNNDIEINVFVSMGDDFEVAVPSNQFQKFVTKPLVPLAGAAARSFTTATRNEDTLTPQSGEMGNSELDGEGDAPFQETSSQLGPTLDPLRDITTVYFGETIKSFRPLLKRYALHEALSATDSSARVLAGTRSLYPFWRGAVQGAVHGANLGVDPYNYCNTLLFHWVTAAHAGYRGGMRYKILSRGARDISIATIGEVERYDYLPSEALWQTDVLNIDFYGTTDLGAKAAVIGDQTATFYRRQSLTGFNGLHRISSDINPALEFEVPYYSNNRFYPGKVNNATQAPSDKHVVPGWAYRLFVKGSNTSLFEIHAAVAEDFTPYFFTGLPPMYYEATPPPV